MIGTIKESKTEVIGYKHYCVYCGDPAKQDINYDEYDRIETWYCDCTGAKIAERAQEDFAKAMSTIIYPKDLRKRFAELEYKYELNKLRGKFQYQLDFPEDEEDE